MNIEEMWNDYRDMVVPEGASIVQITETKRAFFGGMLVVLLMSARGIDQGEVIAALDQLIAFAIVTGTEEELSALDIGLDRSRVN